MTNGEQSFDEYMTDKLGHPEWMAGEDEPLWCIDAHGPDSPCSGMVEYRMPLSGTGLPFPRCDRHWSVRLDREEVIRGRYPRNAPADFDPAFAGERWEED
jgi:hypothetical protein